MTRKVVLEIVSGNDAVLGPWIEDTAGGYTLYRGESGRVEVAPSECVTVIELVDDVSGLVPLES